MKAPFFTTMLLVIFAASLYGQSGSINNTLGTGGSFNIKDGGTTFLSLSQSTWDLNLNIRSINNTLGTGGSFNIKDGGTTFLSLSQSTGNLNLNKSLTLPVTDGNLLGVIYKGANTFIHNYRAFGTYGSNTFVGINSGNLKMSGSGPSASFNTAVGDSSLSSLTTGPFNSAFGCYSLVANTTGDGNSAFGFLSLKSNTTGIYNSAFGSYSLQASTGDGNSAFGYQSLGNIGGTDNSAFGYQAGSNLSSGSNNTFIGYNAQPTLGTVSNQITLGDGNITSLRCNVQTITALSDGRDKKNIRDLALGLDFLMNVKPRLFNWDRREWYEDGKADGSKMQESPTAGFIAQELDEAQMKADAEWLNLVLKSNPNRLEATPGNLLPIVVKAIQELKADNEALRSELTSLRASVADQMKREVRTQMLNAADGEQITKKVSAN